MGRGDIIYYGGLEVAGSDGNGGLLGQKRVKGRAGDSLTVTGTNLDGAAAASVGVIMTNTWGTAMAANTAADAFTYLAAPAVPLLTLNAEFRIGDLAEGAKASIRTTEIAVGQPVVL